jgi:UDP-N-acetylglucosamine 2-epimerase
MFDHHIVYYLTKIKECPYGDGKASEKICEIFKNL